MVDIKKMRAGYQREQRAGEYLNFTEGETLLYIHPQCRPDDKHMPTEGVNYVPLVVHYGVGKGLTKDKDGKPSHGQMIASLDPDLNPIIEHPFIKRYLKQRKVKLTGKCPMVKALTSGDLDGDELNSLKASTRYIWGVTPLATRSDNSAEWSQIAAKPSVLMAGKTLFDGIMEVFFDNGDISDPEAAVLVVVKREGKGMSTKYSIRADTESLKKPKKLSKDLRAALAKALKEDGDCDLFKVAAGSIKSPAEVEALLSGVKIESGDDFDDDDDEEEAKPATKGKKGKTASAPVVEEEDEDESDEDESEDDEEESDDDSEEESDEDESEDEDEDDEPAPPPPPPVKAKKGKAAPPPPPVVDEDDEDESDESEDEDEEDEPAPPPPPVKSKDKAKAKAAEAVKSKPAAPPAEDDDESLGLDEIDAELAKISGEKPAEGKKAKKAKK